MVKVHVSAFPSPIRKIQSSPFNHGRKLQQKQQQQPEVPTIDFWLNHKNLHHRCSLALRSQTLSSNEEQRDGNSSSFQRRRIAWRVASYLVPAAILVLSQGCFAAVDPASSSTAVKVAIDLKKESYKLQSMAGYSTLTALIMNASLRMYTSVKFSVNPTSKRPVLMASIFTASTALCIISGVYTAVLFNILGVYFKEALGMANYEGYLAFQKATALYRKWGFRSFLTLCWSFVASFLMSLYSKTREDDRLGQAILIASVVLALFGIYHIHIILNLATDYVFTPEYKALNNIA